MTTPTAAAPSGGTDDGGPTGNGAPAQAATDWAGAAAQIRSVASWIVKCFAAIATALVGTSPLFVHLADLRFDTRGVAAVSGGAVALLAIGVVIQAASDVSLTQMTDLIDLQTATERPKSVEARLLARLATAGDTYFAGAPTFGDLLAARRMALFVYGKQTESFTHKKSDAKRAEVQQLIDMSMANIATYDAVLINLQKWATYLKIRDAFDRARPRMLLAAGVAAIGLALWLGALGIDPSAGSDQSAAPAGTVTTSNGTVGSLAWRRGGDDPAAIASLRGQLGMAAPACDTATVVVGGGSGDPTDPWQVTLLPDQGCTPTRPAGAFTVDRRFATFSGLPSLQPRTVNVTVTGKGSSVASPYWLLCVLAALVLGVLLSSAFWRPRPS